MTEKLEKKHLRRDFDAFEADVHLWNIITCGSGRGLILMQKIVNANYFRKKKFLPRVLIVGDENSGTGLHARALSHSFLFYMPREVLAKHLGGFYNDFYEFFESDCMSVAHLVYGVDDIKGNIDTILWKFLRQGWMSQPNRLGNDEPAKIVECKGLVIMTANDISKVTKEIKNSVEYVVTLEPYSLEQLVLIVLQRLKYCGVEYENDHVIEKIVKEGGEKIEGIMRFLRICLAVIYADMRQNLLLKDVELAAKLK